MKMENQNNSVVSEGMMSGTFTGQSIDHDLEYIGAPGGTEDNTATVSYVGCGYRYGLGIEQCSNRLPANILRVDYPPFLDKDGFINKVYSKPLSVNNPYNIKLNSSFGVELTKDEFEDYSKLSNVNINNGQDSTFSFSSCKSKPTPIVEQAVSNKTYRPLPDCFTIKESDIDGLGIFATEYIYILGWKDPNVWKTHTYIRYEDACGNDVKELLRTSLGGHLNHSNNPNCEIKEFSGYTTNSLGFTVNKYYLAPLRDISANEEITVNYNDSLFCLTDYYGAEFLKEESNEVINTNLLDEEDYINYKSDKLENRIYKSAYGDMYEYNPSFGKFQLVGVSRNNGRVFYSTADAEIFLNRIK